MTERKEETTLYSKTFACLLGGLIGDAMGTPTENLHYTDIERSYGWVEDFEGDGTDDTLMKNFLVDALVKTGGYATLDDWVAVWLENRDHFYGDKKSKFFISMEHTISKIFLLGLPPRMAALGNMPSTSVGMCISPVGIVNACNPAAAALQAYNLASLVHIHEVGFCQDGPASMAAGVAEAFNPSATVDSIIGAAVDAIIPISGREMRDRINRVVDIARRADSFKDYRAEVYNRSDECFRQYPCDARESIPLAFGVFASAQGSFENSVMYGANLGRDADTVASMAGALAGAFSGSEGIKTDWIDKARNSSSKDQDEMASRLVDTAIHKARREQGALERFSALQ